jgi:hypothetical protein
MKKKYLIVLAVLVMVLAACPTGGGDGTYVLQEDTGSKSDLNPDLTVPATAAEIPDLDTGVAYSADATEAETLVEDAIAAMDEMLSSTLLGGISFSSSAGGARAIQSETFDYLFSEELQAEVDAEIPGAKIYGYAKGSVSYDDANFVPFKLNVDSKGRLEIPDGCTFAAYPNYKIKGYYAETLSVKNLTITESKVSGSVNSNVDYAISIAHVNNKVGIKCAVKMTTSFNASKNMISYTYKVKVFAQNGNVWFERSYNDSDDINMFFS